MMSLYDTERTAQDDENDMQAEIEAAAWNKAHVRLSEEMNARGISDAIFIWDDQTAYFDVGKDEDGDAAYARIADVLGVSFEDNDRSFVNEVLEERFRDLYQLALGAAQ